jgi:signal transduction histidine kinase
VGRQPLRSVRARIVAASAVAVAAVLVLAGVVLVFAVRNSLERPMRGEARARAASVVATINASPMPTVVPPLPAPWPTLVQVLDGNGQVISASAELIGRPALLTITPEHREPTGRTTLVSNGRQQDWRLDAVAASVGGRSVTVVVATSLAQVEQSTDLIAVALSVGVPVLVVLVVLFAWLLVGRALRPVEALRREVDAFDQHAQGRRVAAPATDDEIGRLAGTLNALLDRLEQTGVQQRRFIADASHELRSPVANIRAALEVALAHPAATPWSDVAEEVLDQNERMGRLVSDLLLLARAEAGELVRRDELVDIAAIAGRVGNRATPRRVPVYVEATGEALVEGDEGHIERVVENLVANGLRHASSRVVVATTMNGRWAQLVVTDDGPGVAPEDRARVFERFVRLDADRSRQSGGTGLGLAIVAEVVAAHGGTVTIGDAHPGAVFTVRFPAATRPVLSGSP